MSRRNIRDLSKLLIIDVESTCWEKNQPADQQSEIIEVGIAVLDVKELKVIENVGIIVKPMFSKVSEFCTQLTTLTQKQVDNGVLFPDACETLRNKYNSENTTWASWGDYDRTQFERCCRMFNTKYPFGKTHINVKNLYSIFRGLDSELGMESALTRENLTLEGVHHRGKDDVVNIAKLFVGLV